jgi:sugar phosphate isomerase/epimerase
MAANPQTERAQTVLDGENWMFKNLNTMTLGVSGRQSELIELTLTYGFRGMDINMADLLKRSQKRGIEHACRFLRSANMQIGGFELPFVWNGTDEEYQKGLQQLELIGQIAQHVDARRCLVPIQPASDSRPYHENFELHRQRLSELADKLGPYDIHLGVGLLAARSRREDKQYQFIHQVEDLLTLIKTVSHERVGLLLDTWNWYVGGGAMDQLQELPANQIVAVRLADAPAATDAGELEESDRILPATDGAIDTASILKWLHEQQYDGPVTPFPAPRQFMGMTREAIVQLARDLLDELWVAIGLPPERRAIGLEASMAAHGDVEVEDIDVEDEEGTEVEDASADEEVSADR